MIPVWNDSEIRARTGDARFRRGLEYFRAGAVFDMHREGSGLRARCTGSASSAYRLALRFRGAALESAECSCPVGAAGRCKHVAALMLTWRVRPGDFLEVPAPSSLLENRSREELGQLVLEMLRRRPELEWLLKVPLFGSAEGESPSPALYREQAEAVVRRVGYGFRAEAVVARELGDLRRMADALLARGAAKAAGDIFSELASVVLRHLGSYHDHDRSLAHFARACLAGLGACLARAPVGAAAREPLIRALFALHRREADQGSQALDGEPARLLLTHAARGERARVAGWVQSALAGGGAHARRAHGGLLLGLLPLDDEGFLKAARASGRTVDLVDRLVSLGRVDEAVAEARAATDAPLFAHLAERIASRGQPERAEALARERVAAGTNLPAIDWLKARHLSRGERKAGLELALQAFRAQPDVARYRELRWLAVPLGQWAALRPELCGFLREGGHSSLLVTLLLDEWAIDSALDLVRGDAPLTLGDRRYPLALAVARAAEAPRPRDAVGLYQQIVAALLEGRGRQNYRLACRYLRTILALLEAVGEREKGATYLRFLRRKHRALRAFREELDEAELDGQEREPSRQLFAS